MNESVVACFYKKTLYSALAMIKERHKKPKNNKKL